jgi:hypothetical protein
VSICKLYEPNIGVREGFMIMSIVKTLLASGIQDSGCKYGNRFRRQDSFVYLEVIDPRPNPPIIRQPNQVTTDYHIHQP